MPLPHQDNASVLGLMPGLLYDPHAGGRFTRRMSSALAIARSSSPTLSSRRNPVGAVSISDLGRVTSESHTASLASRRPSSGPRTTLVGIPLIEVVMGAHKSSTAAAVGCLTLALASLESLEATSVPFFLVHGQVICVSTCNVDQLATRRIEFCSKPPRIGSLNTAFASPHSRTESGVSSSPRQGLFKRIGSASGGKHNQSRKEDQSV